MCTFQIQRELKFELELICGHCSLLRHIMNALKKGQKILKYRGILIDICSRIMNTSQVICGIQRWKVDTICNCSDNFMTRSYLISSIVKNKPFGHIIYTDDTRNVINGQQLATCGRDKTFYSAAKRTRPEFFKQWKGKCFRKIR